MAQLRAVDETPNNEQYMIYPGDDPRVIRVMKKIIRGLCYKHGFGTTITEQMVWADILKYEVPSELLVKMEQSHREKDIVRYKYQFIDEPELHSIWIITFYDRTTFIGVVKQESDD